MLELLQLSPNKARQRNVKNFLSALGFQILPLSEQIGHRALIYIEEFSLSGGLRAADALVAATAVENDLPLVSSNYKHYKSLKELKLIRFAPRTIKGLQN